MKRWLVRLVIAFMIITVGFSPAMPAQKENEAKKWTADDYAQAIFDPVIIIKDIAAFIFIGPFVATHNRLHHDDLEVPKPDWTLNGKINTSGGIQKSK